MRIIGGSAGGRRLFTPRGAATRPTADKVRGAIFNILSARGEVPARVLDLYAGTGAMGLEALSRGASEAVFVDRERTACETVRRNAEALGFLNMSKIFCTPCESWLHKGRAGAFGWVFVDPPYGAEETARALALLSERGFVDESGVVVVEHDTHATPPVAEGLALVDQRRYGQTAVSIYARQA